MENTAFIQANKRAKKLNSLVKPLSNQYGIYGYSVDDTIFTVKGRSIFLIKDWN